MEVQDAARDAVAWYVRHGFYGSEDIAIIVGESVPCGDEVLDPDWLYEVIWGSVQQKRDEEETWPAVTDCDRLDAVFQRLESAAVLTLADGGHPEDARRSVFEAYEDDGGVESGFDGYCYYGDLDIKYAFSTGELSLACGAYDAGEAKAAEVGRRVKAAFEGAGFVAEWYDTVPTGLVLKPFAWQRRMPR